MFYAISILVGFCIVLFLFDHKSRYSLLFVIMAMGCTMAMFSLVLHINIFGNYYSYSKSFLFSFDYRIYSSIVKYIRLPLSRIIRFMNAGHFLYLLSNLLLNIEIFKGMTKYAISKKRYKQLYSLSLVFPFFTLLFCDPKTSTYLYVLCHHNANYFAVLKILTVLYKLMVVGVILGPVYSLIRYALLIRVRYFKKRILALALCLFSLHAGYISMFYTGPFSISAEKVWRSGFWHFENTQFSSHQIYLSLSIVTLILMGSCLAVLLTFRLDFSVTLFLEKRVRRNLKLMNEALGDTLHSYKNTLFAMQLCTKKAKAGLCGQPCKELEKIEHLVDSTLANTAHMLDNLGAVKYRFLYNNLSNIIQSASQNVVFPDNIRLVLDETVFSSQFGHYDKYHLEKALINILNNAIEAIMQSGKDEGCVRVEMAFFFRWVVIVISDNGTGISRSVRRKLFVPNYSNKNNKLNWGLGLAYVYKIVKAHFGQIKIISQYGEYTSVMIMLPFMGKEGRND